MEWNTTRKFSLNETVGFTKIIGFDAQKKKYICECVCGKLCHPSAYHLSKETSKAIYSCGCKNKTSVIERVKNSGYLSVKNKIFDNYKRAAEKRNYSFELTKEQFNDLIVSDCHYCGDKPSMYYKYGKGKSGERYTDFKYNGVDRVNNDIGYVKHNVVSCCKICNNSKSTLTQLEWDEWLKRIFDFRRFND